MVSALNYIWIKSEIWPKIILIILWKIVANSNKCKKCEKDYLQTPYKRDKNIMIVAYEASGAGFIVELKKGEKKSKL